MKLNTETILQSVMRRKFTILSLLLIQCFISFSYIFSMPDKYSSSVLLQVQNIKGDSQPSTSSINSLLPLAGLQTSQGDDTNLAIELIQSKELFNRILEDDDLLKKNVYAYDRYNFALDRIKYKSNLIDPFSGEWIVTGSQKLVPGYLDVHSYVISNDLDIYIDKSSGFIGIKYTHVSPSFAKYFVDVLIEEVNEIYRETDLETSERYINYLENRLDETNKTNVVEAINSLITKQLNVEMLANLDKYYLIKPIDPSFIPTQPSGPKRLNLSIFFSFLSIISTFIIVFFIESISVRKS